MSKQTQIYVLIALVLLAAYLFYAERSQGPGIAGVLASDTTFHPLDVDEPHLRLICSTKLKNSIIPARTAIFSSSALRLLRRKPRSKSPATIIALKVRMSRRLLRPSPFRRSSSVRPSYPRAASVWHFS